MNKKSVFEEGRIYFAYPSDSTRTIYIRYEGNNTFRDVKGKTYRASIRKVCCPNSECAIMKDLEAVFSYNILKEVKKDGDTNTKTEGNI